MDKNKWILAGVAILVALQVFSIGSKLLFGGGVGTPFIEDYDPFTKTYGINTQKDITTTGTLTAVAGTFSGALTGAAATLSGLFTTNAGTLNSYTNSTSTTATSYTLVPADMLNYDTVLMTPNVGALTVTFPASSTLSAYIPTAGDMAKQCWVNSTTTSAATITFAAGTGIDLEVASSTTGAAGAISLAIPADGGGCFTFIRKKATATAFDILAEFTRYVDGD